MNRVFTNDVVKSSTQNGLKISILKEIQISTVSHLLIPSIRGNIF